MDAVADSLRHLLADGGFLWMQIAGVGGQGKSRLGWELTLWARERGWQAGLLELVNLDVFAAHWLDSILSVLSGNLTRWAVRLEHEYQGNPFRLDLRKTRIGELLLSAGATARSLCRPLGMRTGMEA